jgi:Integrase core domain
VLPLSRRVEFWSSRERSFLPAFRSPCTNRAWLARAQVGTLYVEPGAPWENGYVEAFHARLRNEFLDAESFANLREAKAGGALATRAQSRAPAQLAGVPDAERVRCRAGCPGSPEGRDRSHARSAVNVMGCNLLHHRGLAHLIRESPWSCRTGYLPAPNEAHHGFLLLKSPLHRGRARLVDRDDYEPAGGSHLFANAPLNTRSGIPREISGTECRWSEGSSL